MKAVCLDLEGVLVPEIWIAFAQKTGIDALKITTREEPDYDKLMHYRMDILRSHKLKLSDIQNVISQIKPLEGAKEFTDALREKTQLIILSDTFEEFANPLMKQLAWPTIMCNSLITDEDNYISGIKMRVTDSKKTTVLALQSAGMQIFAAGDSYNDIAMIQTADRGSLFCAPPNILSQYPDLEACTTYDGLMAKIDCFLRDC